MKRSTILATLAIAVILAVTAQAGDDKFAKLKAELNLSDAQVTQLQQRFKELEPLSVRYKSVKENLTALEAAPTPDRRAIEARKAELETIKKEWKQKSTAVFQAVLTREQFAKHQAMQAEYHRQAQAKKQ